MWVESDWLEAVVERMQTDDLDYLGCNVEIVAERDTVVAQYNQRTGFSIREYLSEKNFAPTCCLVVRRAVVEDVGPFDDQLVSSGDAEFGKRVHRAGYEQAFAQDITMFHPARDTLDALLKKRYRIARGQVQRAHRHPSLFELGRHPLHPFNFLPVRPQILYQTYEDVSFRLFVLFCVVDCLGKLVSSVGQATEWFRQRQQGR
jgi:GT2 family glycosyltransferase